MRINFSKLHYNTKEPAELDFPVEKATLLSQLISAHVNELGFSLNDLSKLLALLPDECAELYIPELNKSGLRIISARQLPRMA
jgi:hypothetical protein